MKLKITAILLIIVMLCLFSACGGDGNPKQLAAEVYELMQKEPDPEKWEALSKKVEALNKEEKQVFQKELENLAKKAK